MDLEDLPKPIVNFSLAIKDRSEKSIFTRRSYSIVLVVFNPVLRIRIKKQEPEQTRLEKAIGRPQRRIKRTSLPTLMAVWRLERQIDLHVFQHLYISTEKLKYIPHVYANFFQKDFQKKKYKSEYRIIHAKQ